MFNYMEKNEIPSTVQVYLGSFSPTTKKVNQNATYYLDIDKLRDFVLNNDENNIVFGPVEDWNAGSNRICKNNFDEVLNSSFMIRSSCWSKFEARAYEENDREAFVEKIDCTIEIEHKISKLAYHNGWFQAGSRLRSAFSEDIISECLEKFKGKVYESFTGEVRDIIKKYTEINKTLEEYGNDEK